MGYFPWLLNNQRVNHILAIVVTKCNQDVPVDFYLLWTPGRRNQLQAAGQRFLSPCRCRRTAHLASSWGHPWDQVQVGPNEQIQIDKHYINPYMISMIDGYNMYVCVYILI